jgi:hypothetical protein
MFCVINTFPKKMDLTSNINNVIKVKVKQSRYRPGVAQRVPGS